jgi:hypothetical protein
MKQVYMVGYRVEEWSFSQIEKAFKLPLREDVRFRLLRKPPAVVNTVVSAALPVYLLDASLPRPDHKDKLSVLAGSFKRLFAEVYKVDLNLQNKIIFYARRYLYPEFTTFTPDQILSTLDWIEQVNHPESRKQQLREAHALVSERGVFPHPGFDDDDPRIADSFVKDEPYEEEKPARWINSSADVIKVTFGPIADRAMEELVKCSSMIKTVPVMERAKTIWTDLGGEGVIAQSSDATAMEDHYANIAAISPDGNDPTQSDPRYKMANDFMLYLIGATPVSRNIINAVRFIYYKTPGFKNIDKVSRMRVWRDIRDSTTLSSLFKNIMNGYRRLKMRHFGHVIVNAILCSGEMDTSFRNTSTMFIMANYAQYDISKGAVTRCRTKNEGDDSLGVYHNSLGPDEDWWERHGWVVKVEFSGLVNEACFCGLVFDSIDLISCPDIRKALAKFGWCGRRYVHSSVACRKGLLRSKALSLACEYGNVPILGELAHALLRITMDVRIRKTILSGLDMYERIKLTAYLKQKPWQVPPQVPERTRALVQKLQNIPIGLQQEIENSCRVINSFQPISFPTLDFNPIWVNNMQRTTTDVKPSRTFNLAGRRRVVRAMHNLISDTWDKGHGN